MTFFEFIFLFYKTLIYPVFINTFLDPLFIPIFGVFFILFQIPYSTINLIRTLIFIEVILLSLSLGFVVISLYTSTIIGHIFALFILALAGCESAMGLSLLILFFRNRGLNVTFEEISSLKG